MEYQNEKIFPDGLIIKKPKEGTPDFVKLNISVKVDEFKAFLDKHNNNGWVNMDFKKSKAGKLYTELNTWKPKTEAKPVETIEYPADEGDDVTPF